ncbi:hypothetical protein SORBI_3001G287000 [Sorghum bicolor]|nr:hypothetical protein SORBI_3001G287000 [Sorghum bicolor]
MNNEGTRSPIKEFSACYGDGCFANGEQDGRQIEDAIHGDRDASRTIMDATDGEQDLCEALADGEEDLTEATEDVSDGEEDLTEATEDVSAGEVSDDQERCTQDISTCYPCDCVANLRLLASSSHRDGSIYTGCRYWQKHFRIADRSEVSFEKPNNGFENPEALYRPCYMWQVFSLKLVKLPVDDGPVELYGYIAARDHVDSLLNYIVNISRDDPITVDQGSFIPMTGPKRGIDLSETVLIEYDMRIKTGDREEDDQQLIDGASLKDPLLSYFEPFTCRIHGNNSAVDMTDVYVRCAVDATVEVIVSEVKSSFDLCVSCYTGGLYEEIRLFDGVIGESHVLRRHVIAVTEYGCLDLKLKVGSGSCFSEEHCCSFKVMDDGYASRQIKTECASIFVKVIWPAATLNV